jgi:bifunctional DNA-binding transcriptional regulator/antitoxin component of YhaV-PrlF toxin-antitoxin module
MIQMEIELRSKNQMTLPDRIVRQLHMAKGTRLTIVLDEEAGEIRLRPIRASYAGALGGIYGRDQAEVRTYLEEERQSWGGKA